MFDNNCIYLLPLLDKKLALVDLKPENALFLTVILFEEYLIISVEKAMVNLLCLSISVHEGYVWVCVFFLPQGLCCCSVKAQLVQSSNLRKHDSHYSHTVLSLHVCNTV